MPAYQIQVQGTLDGSTPFTLPAIIPQPSDGGVIKIDAGAAINVGTFDLNTLAGTDGTPIWLRALHVELAPLTRAARFQGDISGSLARETIAPIVFEPNGGPLMRPSILAPTIIQPIGAELDILTDDTDDTFAGSPVAGPHFVYIDVEPITSDEQMTLLQSLSEYSATKLGSESTQLVSQQAVAANGTDRLGSAVFPAVSGTAAQGQIGSARVGWLDAPAAGESMLFVFNAILAGGAAVEVGRITIDNTNATQDSDSLDVPLSNTQAGSFPVGTIIEVTRTYVAGGGPNMTSTFAQITAGPIRLP